MTRHRNCPDWLDEIGRKEWARVAEQDAARGANDDLIAAYCLVHSLLARRRQAAPHDPEVDARLRSASAELARAIGIAADEDRVRIPTRIFFADEGPPE